MPPYCKGVKVIYRFTADKWGEDENDFALMPNINIKTNRNNLIFSITCEL